MSRLELWTGPPGTGKTTRCIDLFKERVRRTPSGILSRSYFVLPSREHAGRIQNLILRQDVPGLFNAHILTLQDLADRLLPPSGGRPTESIRRAAVTEALEEQGAAGPVYAYFKDSAALRGFQELALESIREFKSSLLSIEEFERRAQGLLRDEVFRSKFRDFSILFKRYEAKLEALGVREAEDDLAALEGAAAVPAPELVIFDGFYHFSRAQRQFVLWAARQAERAVVTLTFDPAHPARERLFGYAERTRAFLLGSGFTEAAEARENHRARHPALAHLAASLFASDPPIHPDGSAVRLIAAPSPRAEYEMVAREVRRLYRESACHFSDICVILRAVSGHRALIESVFREYEIPVAIHERRRLPESGLASALRALLRLSCEGWKRDDVLYLARSSYFRDRLSLEEALELEAAAVGAGLSEGREAWSDWAGAPGQASRGTELVRWLLDLEAAFLASSSPHVFGSHIGSFLTPLLRPAEDRDGLDAAALASISSILASGRRRYAPGAELFDAPRYAREVLSAVESGLLSVKPSGRNRVQVYDAVMALPKEYKVVFISDLLEGSFPRPVTEDPLFKDDERRALNGSDPVLEERSQRLAGERYFFYMAVTRAREKLYLTRSTHDAEGRPALGSFFIDETLRCLEPGSVRRVTKELSDLLPSPEEWETAGDAARGLAAMLPLEGRDRPAFFADLCEKLKDDPGLARAISSSRPGPAVLRDIRVKEHFARMNGPFSASGLDAFTKCAYRYFAEKALDLKQPPEGRHDAEMGNLMHETLYRYFTELSAEERVSGAHLSVAGRMEARLEAILDGLLAEGRFGDQPAYRRAMYRGQMLRMLRNAAALERRTAAESGMAPSYFEFTFGKAGAPPLKLRAERTEILLQGSIDRIDTDVSGKRAVIIDYKKSSRQLAKKIERSEEIQLPLYALAARSLLGLEVTGLEHRVLSTGRRESPDLDTAEIVRVEAAARERIRSTVERIRSGDILVEPRECDYCAFDGICRIESRRDRRER